MSVPPSPTKKGLFPMAQDPTLHLHHHSTNATKIPTNLGSVSSAPLPRFVASDQIAALPTLKKQQDSANSLRTSSFKRRWTDRNPSRSLLTPTLTPLRNFSHSVTEAAFLAGSQTKHVGLQRGGTGGVADPSPRHIHQADLMNHPDTTNREATAWYFYDMANGAFFFAVLIFLPVLITSQAATTAKQNYCGLCPNNSWAANFEYEGQCFGVGDSCGDTGPATNSSCLVAGGRWSPDWNSEAIKVEFLGIPNVGYASISLACTSISVVLQLITFLLTGSLADFGAWRKKMLLGFHLVGCLACLLVVLSVRDDMFWFTGLMYIVGNVSFGSAVIFYNAYLPLLVGADPSVRAVVAGGGWHDNDQMVKDALLSTSNRMSANGFAVGFVGQSVVLLLNLCLFVVLDDDKLAVRLNTAFAGVWALTIGVYCITTLKERPSPPFPENTSVVQLSINKVKKTFRSVADLRQLFTFLFAYFVYSDGTGTIGAAAAIFASIELKMTALQIMYGALLVSFTSAVSCVLFMFLHSRCGVKPKSILLFNLAVLGLIPIYGMLALRCQWEFYVMTAVYGLMYGSEQTFTRALFANAIPHGHEAEYFALFEVTDKGTAWLGPLVVAAVFSATGSFRFAFMILVFFFVVGFCLLLMFDPEKGDRERRAFEEKEKNKQMLQTNNTISTDDVLARVVLAD